MGASPNCDARHATRPGARVIFHPMNTERKLKLYSRRHSVARGNHWRYERDVTEENAQEWLAVFRKDESGVLFLVNNRKPAN